METVLSILFVAYLFNWVIGFCLKISVVRTLQERLPEAGFSNNLFKSSTEMSWKFLKFLVQRDYRKLNDPGLNVRCTLLIGSLTVMFLLLITLPFVVIRTPQVHSSPSAMHSPDFSHDVRIKAPADKVWKALINPETVLKYHFVPLHTLELKKDGAIVYGNESKPMISGKVIDFTENQTLVHTFRFDAANLPATANDPETVVTYEIRPEGEESLLKLRHSGFAGENQTRANISSGWPFILQRLKATLEGPE